MGTALIVIGLIVSLSAFIFAALNMAHSGNDFDGMFSRHLWSMVIMAIGGFMVVAGFLMIGIDLIEKL
ncbi:MAG: hypothetical protein WC455_19075 [Dehalococcoidia bacterium]|jgi:hypothetical protein